nr:hypothetical protein [Candidatus Njordarchaeota archaeon]
MPAENGTTETHAVSGLSPNVCYWFAIKAYDGVPNYGGVSNSPSGTTSNTLMIIVIAAGSVGAVIAVAAVILYVKRKGITSA